LNTVQVKEEYDDFLKRIVKRVTKGD